MFRFVKNKKDYNGKFSLISIKQADRILDWNHVSTYAAISNNGFLDAYIDNNNSLWFPENYVKALAKCNAGALMLYEGAQAFKKNSEIFEKELDMIKEKM